MRHSRLILLLSAFFICPATALPEEAVPDLRLAVSPAGVSRYQRGKWSTLEVRGTNRSDRDRHALLSVHFGDNPQIQYVRRFRIPAATQRQTWLPILPPDSVAENEEQLKIRILEIIETPDGEVLNRRENNRRVSERTLSLADHPVQTGLIFNLAALESDTNVSLDQEALDAIVAGRLYTTRDRKMIDLNDRFLPPYAHCYDGLDQLVLVSDRLLTDSACLPAIRGWISRGGRMWIMLDRVRSETVQALLGDAVPFEVVDRVELTEFTLHNPSVFVREEEAFEAWQAERAVDFVRVLVDSAEVHADIIGWPAAFSIPVGRGEVIFTTLGARGFLHNRDPFAEDLGDGVPTSGETGALRVLADRFFQPRPDRLINKEAVRPVLETQIGYAVPSRGLVGLLLGVNFLTILGTGLWFTRRGKLEVMAIVVPGITVLTAGLFISLGRTNAAGVPASASVFDLVAVSPDTDEIFSDTIASIYSPESAGLALEHDAFDSVNPEFSGGSGSTNRAIWNSDHRGSWEGTLIAPGTVRLIEARRDEALQAPLEARGRFTAEGFSGFLAGADAISEKGDALVALEPAPSMSTEFETGNRFACNEDCVLPIGEHVTRGLLSDEQRRRLSVYRQLLDPSVDPQFPRRPTLFFWGNRRDTPFSLPDNVLVKGATLYVVPLTIERTQPGDPFFVPSSFIRVNHAGGKYGVSGFYDVRTGMWSEQQVRAAEFWFRYLIPAEVRPCEIEQAVLTLKIQAPSRRFELNAISKGEKVVVEFRDNPIGVLEFVIDDPTLLQLEPDGAFLLGLRIGEPTRKTTAQPAVDRRDATHTWQIDYMKLAVRGTTK